MTIPRLSTSAMFSQGLDTLLSKQSQLARTHLEMTTGRKLHQAADSPADAASAQRLEHTLAQLEQMGRSGERIGTRLGFQEQALDDASNLVMRASELAIRANSAALSQSERKMIAVEVRALRRDLIAVANRDDGNDRALFAGTQQGVTAFTDAGGNVGYNGNDGRNQVEVAPGLSISDTDPGSAVFMRVRTGDGLVRGEAAAANTGNLVLQKARATNSADWSAANAPLRLVFDTQDQYRLLDRDGEELAAGSYTPGQTLTHSGIEISLAGTPATGDEISIERAPNRDIFGTLERLADTLEASLLTASDRTAASNGLNAAIGDLSQAHSHINAIRADVGTRRARIDASDDTRIGSAISLKEQLSSMRDTNFVEAAARLSQQLTALDAAQAVMVQTRQLSLFSKL